MVNIIAVGDIMPGGILTVTGNEYASESVRGVLAKADLRVGNFECAVEIPNPNGKKVELGGNTVFVKEKDVERVKSLGIDVVSIANNHLFDLGIEGARKAIETLDNLGIRHCGAGMNLAEARKPVIIKIGGKVISFLGYSQLTLAARTTYFATDTEPGVCPLVEDIFTEDIRIARETGDYVVVIPHWGVENTYYPPIEVVDMSKKLVAAGADIILGGHSHRVQPIIKYRKSVIVYSMGNFLFPDRIIVPPKFTWYPEDEIDLDSLPTTIGIPLVERPTIKCWRPLAYIGSIVNVHLDDKSIKTNYMLTLAHKNGLVKLLDTHEKRHRFILKYIGLSLKINLYPIVFKIHYRLTIPISKRINK